MKKQPLTIGKKILAAGCFTERKYLYGCVRDFERKIGYNSGRLKTGFAVLRFDRIPGIEDFSIEGYSTRPTHREMDVSGLDVQKIKALVIKKFEQIGANNLIKIIPVTGHSDDMDLNEQYPMGAGIPQWKLTRPLPMTVIEKINAHYEGLVKFK